MAGFGTIAGAPRPVRRPTQSIDLEMNKQERKRLQNRIAQKTYREYE